MSEELSVLRQILVEQKKQTALLGNINVYVPKMNEILDDMIRGN